MTISVSSSFPIQRSIAMLDGHFFQYILGKNNLALMGSGIGFQGAEFFFS
jgi:hypothetical protein